MSAPGLDRLDAILEQGGEPDDVLRRIVDSLTDEPGIAWAGIAFIEGGELVLGPSAGEPDERRRRCISITYQDDLVGELRVDGEADQAPLARIAGLVAPYVLIGWDTGGEAWEP
jgi:hypothetical protein